MSQLYSDQIGTGGIGGGIYAPVDPSALSGRVRISRFSWTCPSVPPVASDTLLLCQIPESAIILVGKIMAQASFVATAVKVGFNTGIAGDDVLLSSSIDLSSTTEVVLGNLYTTALQTMPKLLTAPNVPYTSSTVTGQNMSDVLNSQCIMLTWTGSNLPAAGKSIVGYFQWVLD